MKTKHDIRATFRYTVETLAELTALALFVLMLGTWAGYFAGV